MKKFELVEEKDGQECKGCAFDHAVKSCMKPRREALPAKDANLCFEPENASKVWQEVS